MPKNVTGKIKLSLPTSLFLLKFYFMSQFHKLEIQEVTRETEQAVTLNFAIPEALQETFTFIAGQYITLKTELDGREIRRDYSICTSPGSGSLKVAVKAVPEGAFSVYANTKLKAGDVLEVSPPNGRFVFRPEPSKSRTIVAFAAGSGITPVMSIVKTVLEEEPGSKMALVYGNKRPADVIFLEELRALQSANPSRLHLQLVYSQANESDALFGRIDRSAVNYVLKNALRGESIERFYICGPESMIHTITDILTADGVDKANILYELFTVSQPAQEVNESLAEGQTVATVLVDEDETTFEMSQKQTILEAALVHDVDAPYSCQGGICSTCLARLTEGEAVMRQNNILTDAEIEEGLILTCQAVPTTAKIVVDYDDV